MTEAEINEKLGEEEIETIDNSDQGWGQYHLAKKNIKPIYN